MRRTTARAGWAAIAATVMTLVGPVSSAHADFGDTLKGGCGFATHRDAETVNGTDNEGVIYVLALSQEQNGDPSSATVECWIENFGEEQPGTHISVTANGVLATEQQTSYDADPNFAQISLCQKVTFSDGSTWVAPDGSVGTDCQGVTEINSPPQAIFDLIDTVKGLVLDPVVCPVLVALGQATGGHIAGAITINPDGDLFIAQPIGPGTIWVYDCAPYGNNPGTPLVGNPLSTLEVLRFLLPPSLLP